MRYSDQNPHTNLSHEITGAYYEKKVPWYLHAAYFFLAGVLTVAIADLIFGPEAVTYWVASLIS